jgi:hypothetical protein
VALHRSATTGQAHRRGPLARFGAILDASVGMLMLRRALGRSTMTRADRAAARLQAETEAVEEQAIADAYAARLAAAAGGRPPASRPTRLVVAGTAAEAPRPEDRDRQAHPVGGVAVVPVIGRARLWRDGAIAVAVLAAVLVGAIAILPGADGEVLPATGTPGTSEAPVAASPVATADEPSASVVTPDATPDRTSHAASDGDARADRAADRHAVGDPDREPDPRSDSRTDPRTDPRPDARSHARSDTGSHPGSGSDARSLTDRVGDPVIVGHGWADDRHRATGRASRWRPRTRSCYTASALTGRP